LQAAWDKYGEVAFTFTVVEVVDDPTLILGREQYWIDVWRERKQCYNIADATGPLGTDGERQARHLTDEHKERIRQANIGRKMSDEAKKKIGDAHRGRKHTEEQSKAQSEQAKARGMNPASLAAGALARVKTYNVPVISPDGTRYETITNLRVFCQEHHLNYAAMRNVIVYRTMNNHRGWRRADEEPITREAAISRAVKARLQDPAERAKVGTQLKAMASDPNRRAQHSQFMKGVMADPVLRARRLAGMRTPEAKERSRLASIENTYRFIAPDGTEHTVTDLSTFCREHGLVRSSMVELHQGKRYLKSCKGWRKAL